MSLLSTIAAFPSVHIHMNFIIAMNQLCQVRHAGSRNGLPQPIDSFFRSLRSEPKRENSVKYKLCHRTFKFDF